MNPGYRTFEFDLPGALLADLVKALDGLTAAPLNNRSLAIVDDEQGVYQLLLDDQIVYIGKTDAEAGLRARLTRHERKIQHRIGLDPTRLSFKAVRIYVFTAVDLETQLIKHYGGPSNVPWIGSGFGSNDPGRNRDTMRYKNTHFDLRYSINIDQVLNTTFPMSGTAASILTALRNAVPYAIRSETGGPHSHQLHPELVNTSVTLPNNTGLTTRNVISAVVSHLPTGWQATQLPGYIILYKEIQTYQHGIVISRSP